MEKISLSYKNDFAAGGAARCFQHRQAPLRRVFCFFLFYLNENFSASGNNFQKNYFFNFIAKFLLLRKIKFWKIFCPCGQVCASGRAPPRG